MNEKLQPIFARRSVRKFTKQPVTEVQIQDVLEAAMSAPSANARDPWEILVIRRPDSLHNLAEILPYGKMLKEAAVGFVVCGDLERANGKELSYLLQDCSACIENLLLGLSMLGLGGVWLGVHPREERVQPIRQLCALPPNVVPVGVIAAGYPAETPPPRTRFKEEHIHWDTW